MKIRSLLLLFLVTLVFSCKKSPESPPLNSEKELLEFKLEKSLNSPYLSQTITGRIDNSVIEFTLPSNIDTAELIATFSFKGVSVFVGAVMQESGVTPNNFSKPTIYTVIAADGSTKKYEVEVHKSSSWEKSLITFSIPDSLNEGIVQETITGDVNGDEVDLNIPNIADASSLIAAFSFKGKAVYLNGVKQESGVTSNNFTQPITYTIQAEDGSSKEYVIKVTRSAILPHIYIQTDGNAPIVSKDDYLEADIKIDGMGAFADYEGRTGIRGRGNTSWGFPKQPYKLKLDEKEVGS